MDIDIDRMLSIPEKDRSELEDLVNMIKSKPEVESVYLFGSYAEGRYTSSSDFDLYVVVNNKAKDLGRFLFDINYSAYDYCSKPVDILGNFKDRFNDRKNLPTLERSIAQKGILLYG